MYDRPGSRLTCICSPASIAAVFSGTRMYPFALVNTVMAAVSPVTGMALNLPYLVDFI